MIGTRQNEAAYGCRRDQGGAENCGEVKKLTASDAVLLGASVAVSGDTAVVSATGAAYVFQRDQGGADNWGEVKKLTASDAEAGDSLGFGVSVAIAGDSIVVGAICDDAGGVGAGATYVFRRHQGGVDNWRQVTTLTASDAVACARLGFRTPLSTRPSLGRAGVDGKLAEALRVRSMKSRIDALTDHSILCGFGRVGDEIAREFSERNAPFVIIEKNAEAIDRCVRLGYLVVEGDATEDDVLIEAGIMRARVLMAASDSDAGNTYMTLAAKALRPDLHIVARMGQAGSEALALRAGADRVISPYSLAGRHMAVSALQPLTVDFFDLMVSERDGRRLLAELIVTEESLIANMQAHEAMRLSNSTTLLAIQHAGGDVLVGPPDTYALQPGDRLMLITNESDMEQLGRTRDATTATTTATGSGQPNP